MIIGKKYLVLLITGTLMISLMTGAILGTRTEVRPEMKNPAEEGTDSLSEGPWPSFGRDAKNTGLSPYNSSYVDGTINWTFETDTWLWSSPAIGSEGVMYFGSPDNRLYALNTENGTEEWSFETDGGVISSPAVSENETIYFGTENDNFYALDSDGNLKWNYSTEGEIYSSPNLDDDGNIYFGSSDGHLYSLTQNGNLNWRVKLDEWVWSSPALGENDTVYAGSGDGTFYAIDRDDGTVLWNFSTGGFIYSSPAVDENGTIYFGSYDNNLYALNPNGTLKWDYDVGSEIHPSPALGEDGTVYVGSHDGMFSAVKDGELKWSFETSDRISSSAAISSDGTIYFGSEGGSFYSLDMDGNKKWSYDIGNHEVATRQIGPFQSDGVVYSSPAIAEDGRVFMNSFDSNVYAFTGSDLDMDISKEVEMSVRLAGRWGNNLTATVQENGDDIRCIEIEREPGIPQKENMTFKFREDTNYNLTLKYENEHKGVNPTWIRFNSGNKTSNIFELFSHSDGDEHVVEYDLTEEIGDMISRVKEVHFSAIPGIHEGSISSHLWEFGDGTTAEGKNVVHTYQSIGKYQVNLTVTLDSGESVTLEKTLVIEKGNIWSYIRDFIYDLIHKNHLSHRRTQGHIPV